MNKGETVDEVLQVLQRTGRPYFHAKCYVRVPGDFPMRVLEMRHNPPCSVCGEAVFQERRCNPLGILCPICWKRCVLSEDGKRWMCPEGCEGF